MAHKSIADQILMDLKKGKKKPFGKDEDWCLEFMQKRFDSSISYFMKCEVERWYYFSGDFNSLPLSRETFASVAKSLGFKINDDVTAFLVPKCEKEQKMTPAQEMLHNHIIAFNKKEKAFNLLMQAELNRIWESIKRRDFSVEDQNDGSFILSIRLRFTSFEEIWLHKFVEKRDLKILKFLSTRAFPNATIKGNEVVIVLGEKK